MGKPFIDRTGQRYGRLTATQYLGKLPGKAKNYWQCQCDCGTLIEVTTSNLSTGHTQSCGCVHTEEMESRRIYPKEVAAEYGIWRGIKQRAGTQTGKNATSYRHVQMDPTWRESFDRFYIDMGPRPSKNHSIERIDCSKGYEPSNCIWATSEVQANNRSTNHVIEFNGESLTIAQWAKRTGIKKHTIHARVTRYGWSIEDALTNIMNQRRA